MFKFDPIKNLLYILQSSNYEIVRFLKYAYKHPAWWRLEQRQKLKWTLKAKLIYFLSLVIIILKLIFSLKIFGTIGFFSLILIIPSLPFFLIVTFIILWPFDHLAKQRIIKRAEELMRGHQLIVIGITGSYGKTSTKEILTKILEEKFSVLENPENINTDIGIAEFIISKKDELPDYKIFIVEMGAYRVGDIEKICRMVRPKYSILTGINEAHLEKFGSIENTIKAKFELPENTSNTSILNFTDDNIKENYKKFKIKNLLLIDDQDVRNIIFRDNFKGLEFEINNIKYETQLLAKHNIILILLARSIAIMLGLSEREITNGVKKTKPLSHRLEPIFNNQTGITIIDDSYNGNINGIISGLEVLSSASGRKIVLTPGLVEQGSKTAEIHRKIGSIYTKNVDLVLIVKNQASQYIIDGMEENNFNNFKLYENTVQAHKDLKNILKSGDTIIFQNDWPDVYF